MEMTLVSEVLLKLIEDIKAQCHVILNACGRMRRARASKLYCNISFVKYSIMVTIVATELPLNLGQSPRYHTRLGYLSRYCTACTVHISAAPTH